MPTIEDMKKGASNKEVIKTNIEIKVEEKKKSIRDEFLEELNPEEKEICLKLESALIDKCELLEFEIYKEDNLNDFRVLIDYTKNGILTIVEDGVNVKLRREIKTEEGAVLTNNVTILFERNEDRERVFTKPIKVKKDNVEDQKSFTRATLAASLKNIGNVMIGSEKLTPKHVHHKDYLFLLTCYNFFRN